MEGYQVGKTKVFLRYFHVDLLNDLLRPFPNAATSLQKGFKDTSQSSPGSRSWHGCAKEVRSRQGTGRQGEGACGLDVHQS